MQESKSSSTSDSQQILTVPEKPTSSTISTTATAVQETDADIIEPQPTHRLRSEIRIPQRDDSRSAQRDDDSRKESDTLSENRELKKQIAQLTRKLGRKGTGRGRKKGKKKEKKRTSRRGSYSHHPMSSNNSSSSSSSSSSNSSDTPPPPTDHEGSRSPNDSPSGSSSDDDAEVRTPHKARSYRRYKSERFAVTNVKLENFSGEKSEEAEAWLIRAERIMKAGRGKKSRYVGFISLRLRGNASTWYDQLPHLTCKDYDLFKAAFLKTFQEESTATHGATLRALENIRQGPSEMISSYYIRFSKGITDVQRFDHLGNVAIVRKYILGMREEFQDKASWYQRKEETITVTELNTKMLIRELHVRERRKNVRPNLNAVTLSQPQQPAVQIQLPATVTTATTEFNLEKAFQALQQEVKELRNQVKRQGPPSRQPWTPKWTSDGQPICSHCDQAGHMRKQCPQRRPSSARRRDSWCDYHKVFGHTTDECRARKGAMQTQRDSLPTQVKPPPTILRLPAPPKAAQQPQQATSGPAAQQRGFRQPTQE